MRAFAISRSNLKVMPASMQTKDLLRWNRRSVSRAMLIGLFVVPLPIPAQMLLAALLASLLRANLPLAVSLVWVSNPLTILPIAWFCTVLGCGLLNQDPAFLFSLQVTSISELLELTWRPLFIGALCCGVVLGLAGYHCTQLYWRSSVLRRWRSRSKISAARHRRSNLNA